MKTKVSVYTTKVTYIDIETKELTTFEKPGKLTVKDAKELLPTNTVLVTKISEKQVFEVDTDALLELKQDN